jgi:gliding motility-associated-like protein
MKFCFVNIFKLLTLLVFTQQNFVFGIENEPIWMFTNVGQYPNTVQYQIDIDQGDFFIDNEGFTFSFFESPRKHHHESRNKREKFKNIEPSPILKGQTIKTKFLNARLTNHYSTGKTSNHYKTFFKTEVSTNRSYGNNSIRYNSIYKGIDLELSTDDQKFKYSFYVLPNADVKEIKQKTEGTNGSFIDKEGNLHHKNIFGEIIEKKPKAWNVLDDNSIKEVDIEFNLNENIITYSFPNDYDRSLPLVIDPELIFSSFTGSTSDNWGFTATNDEEGNLYTAGICFGIGYPTTPGVFDINYHAGEVYQISNNGIIVNTIPGFDVTISKFSKDGKKLLYSSYLGGSGNETPNSIIVNKNNELLIFGATSSSDFPITSNAFDKTYNGGSEFKTMDFYFTGSDIFITRFNQNGDKLVASTFIGGTNNDGISKGDLIYNYGDNFRGEINLTSQEEVLVMSTTNSIDFPIKNAFQNSMNGNNDAIVLKLSPNLDQLLFSSYLGGLGEETGNSIQYSKSNNKIYISGGTTSNEVVSIKSKIKNNYLGGSADGYIGIINNQSYNFESFRYIGTSSYDQVYFVQLDAQLNTYLLGQTEGKVGISSGKYGNPNSGQFISKFNQDLSQFLWSTTIGGQSGFVEISPTAFLVSECNDIFLAGWGSSVNQYEEHAMNSSTLNFPVTEDAIQKTTEGDNFYIAVLNNDGENLKYGTFFGGVGSFGAHVDGGTCRFDKKGGIYHAVCGGCGGNPSGFTTTTGVWSEENKSPNCNLAAFKIELNKIQAEASASDSIICSGGEIIFTNKSKSADTFEWDFGDKSTSEEKNPTHVFKNEGQYKVQLIARDSKNCVLPDTTYIDITVKIASKNKTIPITYLCKDTLITLEMDKIDNATYTWKNSLNNTINETKNKLTIKITPPMTVIGTTIENCTSTNYEFRFEKLANQLDFVHDISICLGEEVNINIGQVSIVDWVNHPEWKNKSELSISPTSNKTLFFSANTLDGCPIKDSLHIAVLTPSSKLISFNDTVICYGDSIKVNTKYVSNFTITPSDESYRNKNFIYLKPKTDKIYAISYDDPCGKKTETFSISLRIPFLKISKDTIICFGDSVMLTGSNMKTYEWQNYDYSKIQQKTNELKVSPKIKTDYFLIGKDELGCRDTKKTTISIYPKTKFKASILEQATWQNPAIVHVTGNDLKSIKWNPNLYLSNDSSFTVSASIFKNQSYSIIVNDENNCRDSALIYLDFEATVYIPNAFYPDSKNGNSIFKGVGLNIREFEMTIYNRWGELLKTINTLDEGWDGTYQNQLCPNDIYTWKVKYLTDREERKELTGHVALLR